MRRTLLSWVSGSWRPHAEFIQSLIARSAREPRELQQARTYLHELKVEQSVEEVDDVTDLLYFMHRVSYPAESHLESKAGEFLASCASSVCGHHILGISRRMQEEPNSGPLWSRVIFERAWFIDGVSTILEKLTLEEHLSVCGAYWQSMLMRPHLHHSCRHSTSGSVMSVATKLAALTVQRIEASEAERAASVCLCAKLGILLQGEIFADLRAAVLSHARAELSAEQVLEVAETLTIRRFTGVAEADWLGALQDATCFQRSRGVRSSHAVGLLRSMALLQYRSLSKGFEDLLLCLLPSMSQEEVFVCCDSLSSLSCAAPELRTGLQRMLCDADSKGPVKTAQWIGTALWRLSCLSPIAPLEARKLLSHVEEDLKDTGRALSPDETKGLIRSMRKLHLFPPTVVSLCKSSYLENSLQSFNQHDAVYMMYAAAHTGEKANSPLMKEALNRLTAARKFDRRQMGCSQANVLSIDALEAMLCAFQVVQGGQLLDDQRVYAVLRNALERLWSERNSSPTTIINLLRQLGQLNISDTSLLSALLTAVSRSLTSLTPENVEELCRVLVALKSRDALMFRALLRHLAQSRPDNKSLASVATAARKLKFVQYFQQSDLLQHITSLEGWGTSDAVLVASTCSVGQRTRLLALPGAQPLLETRAEDLSTIDLFLLMSILGGGKRAITMASVLSTRQPLTATDVEVEDVLRAVAGVLDDKNAVAAVCRSAAATLQTVDETMLMQILETVTPAADLPNAFFRVVGKSVLRLASSMTVDNALRWLDLYVRYQIRDDSIGKALLMKARTRSSHCAGVADKTINRASEMYGRSYALQCKLKKPKERLEWYSYNSC
uniref:Uncharacterized protein n=1 Tax=Trypanosoma congolense (strain IL3000) TaxID=1068625 RepID=G0ULH0_TRYCI|nr:conserved hypothetical protein [Trypanosoma congolense IL3000]